MMMLAYSALLTLGLVLSAPWWLFRMATTERYREGLGQRLGFVPAALKAAVAGKRVVWLHAVSVGEVLAATRLVAELEAALGEGWIIAVSTTTRTGQALAQQRFGDERVFYMPLDFAFAVRAYLRALKPAALILMESELWPRLLHECARRNIPVAVANARVSDRSFRRAMKVRGLWKHLVRKPTLWLAQSEEDARRLLELGAAAETTQTSGNLKYDIRAPKESRVAELIKEAAAGRPILVAGSTVDGEPLVTLIKGNDDEETYLLTAYGGRIRNEIGAMLVIAPRHPERFDEVWEDAVEFPTLRASELLSGKTGSDAFARCIEFSQIHKADVIVVDTIGDLAAIYGIADLAFLGGSLVKRGGHNPLEAAQFGVPVVMGPSFENFRAVVDAMLRTDGISILNGNADSSAALRNDKKKFSPQEMVATLEAELVRLLTDREAAKTLGQRGRAVFESQQGATARSVAAILGMIKEAKP